MYRTTIVCLCIVSWLLGTETPSSNFFPLQPGNQWVLESENDPKEILNIRVHRSKSVDGFTYYLVSGYAPAEVWIRQTPEGKLFTRNMETGVEEEIARLSEGAHAYQTPLGGCIQEARPAGMELGIPETLRMNYEPGNCRDVGLSEEVYFLGVGLMSRTISTIRGATTYHLAHAKVGGQTMHENPKELLFHDRFSHDSAGWLDSQTTRW